MFDMFRGLGQFANVLRHLPKIKEEMGKFQQKLGQIVAEGDAGAGMVKVRVNGRMEVLGFTISDDLVKQHDREMLEDLLKAATNQALDKVRAQVNEETGKMATELGLPAGLNLPGLG
jgi:DNA-binding YbaB/EbfC family protein